MKNVNARKEPTKQMGNVRRSTLNAPCSTNAGGSTAGRDEHLVFLGHLDRRCGSPNGAVSSSPGLRGTSYPGERRRKSRQPQRGWVTPCGSIRRNPIGVVGKSKLRTQGSPRGAGNLGLKAAAPLGLNLVGSLRPKLRRSTLSGLASNVDHRRLKVARPTISPSRHPAVPPSRSHSPRH